MYTSTPVIVALWTGLFITGCPAGQSVSPNETAPEDTFSTDDSTSQTNTSSPEESDTSPTTDAGPQPPWYACPEESVHTGSEALLALDRVDHYFNPEDHRTAEAPVSFPSGDHDRITLRVELECPADGVCDRWDRVAQLFLVDKAGQADESPLELARYITPFGAGMCFEFDVTAYGRLLSGKKTVRSFIDTWVGPQEPVHGHGWRVTARFFFRPGVPTEPLPSQIVDLWGSRSAEVGNPATPLSEVLPKQEVSTPSSFSRAELRLLATGHGQGNADNCAEFCSLRRRLTVGQQVFSIKRWRYDCDENPTGSTQAGTWSLTRNGWCPGAVVEPSVVDVSAAMTPGATVPFAYDVETPDDGPYANTCRPQEDADATCEGCVFHPGEAGNCAYNGGDHTPPTDRVSAHLLFFE